MATRDLTADAREGYDGKDNGKLYSSPAYYAHALGAHLLVTGRTAPRDVRMGRGDSIRANDMRFSIKHPPKGATPKGATPKGATPKGATPKGAKPVVTFERVE